MKRLSSTLAASLLLAGGLLAINEVANGFWQTEGLETRYSVTVASPPEEPPPSIPAECLAAGLTEFDEVVVGTDDADIIDLRQKGTDHLVLGLGGDDTIYTGNGKDCIDAGDGDDYVEAGNGVDVVLGGDGDDTLLGGNGKDYLDGGPGDDTLVGGNGKDELIGGPGTDTCGGGNGDDVTSCEP